MYWDPGRQGSDAHRRRLENGTRWRITGGGGGVLVPQRQDDESFADFAYRMLCDCAMN